MGEVNLKKLIQVHFFFVVVIDGPPYSAVFGGTAGTTTPLKGR